MIAWLKQNWRPTASVAFLVGMYLFAKFGEVTSDEYQLLQALAAVLGLFGTAFVPSFKQRDE